MITERQSIIHNSRKGYESFEINLGKTPSHLDPFDSHQLRLDAHIVTPGARHLIIPCFYDDAHDATHPWHLRFLPFETGPHTLVFRALTHGSELVFEETLQFHSLENRQENFQFFKMEHNGMRYPDGRLRKGIGINFSWEEEPGRRRGKEDYAYETFLPKLKSVGLNFVRMWSCPWNLGFIWHTPSRKQKTPHARYHAARLLKIDSVFETALEAKIHLMWCLDYHGALKEKADYWGGNAFWPEHPYNRINGGPCDKAESLFTNETAKQAYRDRLRYIIARWGYSPSLAVIEFWNEIDNAIEGDTHPIDMQHIIQWHREMAAYLNELDTYQRPVSTSLSHTLSKALFGITDLDFAQLHLYEQSEQLGEKLDYARRLYHKPTIVAEVGYDWRAPEPGQETWFKNDLKLALWKAMFNKTPVLPMAWWWELYNENGGLPLFEQVSAFADTIEARCNWNVQTLSLVDDSHIESRAILSGCTADSWIWVRMKESFSTETPLSIDLSCVFRKPLATDLPTLTRNWLDAAECPIEPQLRSSLKGNLFSFIPQPNVTHYIFEFSALNPTSQHND